MSIPIEAGRSDPLFSFDLCVSKGGRLRVVSFEEAGTRGKEGWPSISIDGGVVPPNILLSAKRIGSLGGAFHSSSVGDRIG